MDNLEFDTTTRGVHITIPKGSRVASARFTMRNDGGIDFQQGLRQLSEAWSDHFKEKVPFDRLQIIAATYTGGITVDFIVPPKEN